MVRVSTASSPRRTGFTLVEMVFAVAIVALIGSSVIVTLTGYRDRRKVDESHDFLTALSDSLIRYDAILTRHPARLNHLTTMIDGSRATNYQGDCGDALRLPCRTSCGAASVPGQAGTFGATATYNYVAADTVLWRDNGPFFHRELSTSGTLIGIGTVSDTLIRTPATVASTTLRDQQIATLQIQITDVSTAAAQRLDRLVDGVRDSANGVVRWSTGPTGGRYPRVFWGLRVRGC